MDSLDKLFIFMVYAAAIGVPFCIIGLICERAEKRGNK